MVFCCTDDASASQLKEERNTRDEIFYPGQRRLVKTAGNALAAAGPSGRTSKSMVQVTIPEDVVPGQLIRVRSPDGSNLVDAQVPMGLKPGQTFQVKFPKQHQKYEADAENLGGCNALDAWLTPHPSLYEVIATPISDDAPIGNDVPGSTVRSSESPKLTKLRQAKREKEHGVVEAAKVKNVSGQHVQARVAAVKSRTWSPNSIVHPVPVPVVEEKRQQPEVTREETNPSTFAKTLEDFFLPTPAPPQSSHAAPPSSSSSAPQQKVMLVHVPPGMPAGATMQVEVPGENRTLSVQVPPQVSSFHVAYLPRVTHAALPPLSLASSNTESWWGSGGGGGGAPQHVPAAPVAATATAPTQHPSSQRLLLVRVPPGTAAGTTLHVSVPDEPGRILAAQVPPGNVLEFHVAYEPRASTTSQRSMLPPANAYHNYQGPQQQQQQQRAAPTSNQQSGSFGDFFLPFLGAAALGTAGVGVYEHMAHRNDNDNVDDGGYDGGDDGGGGDWGVDF